MSSMTTGQGISPGARSRIAALVLANFLASVGGGRVLSAGKGLTNLKVLGSGSLLALLVGSVISLLILRLAHRSSGGRALVGVSAASAICSAALLWLYRGQGPARVATSVAGGGGLDSSGLLSGAVAWVFFGGLVFRCALWFAGRSLRTGFVSSISRPGLALSEAAYFGGLVAGLLIGMPSFFRGDPVLSAFTLDIVMLVAATLLDLSSVKMIAPVPLMPAAERRQALPSEVFLKLTSAYAAATIGCQIVVFQLADALARSPAARSRAWADPSLAAFYVGVAAMAVAASALRPALATDSRPWPVVSWRMGERKQGTMPVAVLCLLAGSMTIAGVLALFAEVGSPTATAAAHPTWPALAALAAIVVGAGIFEIVALAVLARLSAGGQQSVAVALGIAATAATAAMFMMLLAGVSPGLWAGVTVIGLAATAFLVRQSFRLNQPQQDLPAARRQSRA